MATKKLISFEDDHIELIEKYCKDTGVSFTQAVKQLAMLGLETFNNTKWADEENKVAESGLPTETDRIMNDLRNLEERVDKVEEDKKFWNADETQSKLSNVETQISDFEKKLNTLIKLSKLFKAHIGKNDIHLQDS